MSCFIKIFIVQFVLRINAEFVKRTVLHKLLFNIMTFIDSLKTNIQSPHISFIKEFFFERKPCRSKIVLNNAYHIRANMF